MLRTFCFLFLACLGLTGCYSFTPVGPIGEPVTVADNTAQRGAQIADVAITAPDLKDDVRLNISRQLTAQISHYVDRGEYFTKLVEFPATLVEQDVVLKFTITSLKGKRTTHPGYVPGALVTLTFWIWFNGPIYVDKYDLAGELVIEDRDGKRLTRVTEQVKLDNNVGLYDNDYANGSLGGVQLRQLITRLLDTATAAPQLATH